MDSEVHVRADELDWIVMSLSMQNCLKLVNILNISDKYPQADIAPFITANCQRVLPPYATYWLIMKIKLP